jgi:ribosome-binding protein aMBF1 (putative translation factor)
MTARSVFADLLAGYRREAGWTQAEAAQQFTMSKSLYQKIEACERKPQRDMADRADALFGLREVSENNGDRTRNL